MVGSLREYFAKNQERTKCYVFGMGGQSRSTYLAAGKISGAIVRLSHTSVPVWWLRWVGRLIPSFAGIVEIVEPDRLAEVFGLLEDSTLVAIYIVDARRADEFMQLAEKRTHPEILNDWIRSIGMGVFYKLNSDNPSSTTDMYDWLILGDGLETSDRIRLESAWRTEPQAEPRE